jgi:hypothetical protein
VTHVKAARAQAAPPGRPQRGWLGRDSFFWLALVSVLFLLAELTPSLVRMPLGADEIGYIAQLSAHASGVQLPPVHGQGAGLLAAPVTLLTTSLTAVRVWMSVLSAVGLFLALLAWRGLRPPWVLALAGLIIGMLAITQNSGVQVYPDWWSAVGILALAGLFLHAVNGSMRDRVVLPLVGLATLLIVLMRPQNIVFILGPILIATVLVPGWRKPKVWAALVVGIGLGAIEWAAESVWYGGLGDRVHLGVQEPPPFALNFSFLFQIRVLSGPWYCQTSSGSCAGMAFPGELIWFIGLALLAVIGLVVAWERQAKASAVLAAGIALWVLVLYSFLVPFAAPRYILPTLALGAILAADGIAWLVTESGRRTVAVVAVSAFLLVGIVTQRIVLNHEVAAQSASSQRGFQAEGAKLAAKLTSYGVKAPCAIWSPYVAYYAGCTGPWTGETKSELLSRMGGASNWRQVHVPGYKPGQWVYEWTGPGKYPPNW